MDKDDRNGNEDQGFSGKISLADEILACHDTDPTDLDEAIRAEDLRSGTRHKVLHQPVPSSHLTNGGNEPYEREGSDCSIRPS